MANLKNDFEVYTDSESTGWDRKVVVSIDLYMYIVSYLGQVSRAVQ